MRTMLAVVVASGLAAGAALDDQTLAKEGDRWQMPQGGIDQGEEIHAAAFRELAEETGVGESLATIIATAPEEQLLQAGNLTIRQ